jgi:predicted permease
MKTLRRIGKRLAATFAPRRAHTDAELADEFEAHIALLTEKNIRRGMSPTEARRAALLKFGALEPTKETYRDQRALPFLDSLRQDIRYALRGMRLNPGFTLVVVLCLALGIGANAAMFSVINSVLLRPLPFKDSERLVSIMALPDARHQPQLYSAPTPDAYTLLRAQTTIFSDLIAFQTEFANFTGGAEPLWVQASSVSGEFFAMLGMKQILGRSLSDEDVRPGHEFVAVLSYRTWQREFGGDPGVVGRRIFIDARPYEIVGVMPATMNFPQETQIWLPLPSSGMAAIDPRKGYVRLTAKLSEGVTLQQAQTVATAIAGQLSESDPKKFKDLDLRVSSISKSRVESVRHALLLLFGAVALVLLIACANVGNLFLARGWKRQREFAVRAALGASRARLIRQLLVESVATALLGGAIGLAFAAGCAGVLRAIAPTEIPRIGQLSIDRFVILFTISASILSGGIFGLIPALQLSGVNLNSGLKSGPVRAGARSWLATIRVRELLTTAEVALCLILLVGSSLAMRSFFKLLSTELGFHTEHILSMRIVPPKHRYLKDDQSLAVELQVAEKVRSVPGVDGAAVKIDPFLAGFDLGSEFRVPGQSGEHDGQRISVRYVDPGYFKTIRIALRQGRIFSENDDAAKYPGVVVNEAFVNKRLGGKSPLGRQVAEKAWGKHPETMSIIVGVVADVRDQDVSIAPEPTVYFPFSLCPYNYEVAFLLVRTATPPAAMVKSIEQQVWSVDKDIPIEEVETGDQLVSDLLAEPKFHALLLSAFAGLGLTLALVGIYGVVSYSVGQRTREIGIRMALGAQRKNVMLLVLAGGMLPVAIGIAIGTGGALALTRLIRSFLFEISATDPATYSVAALAFCAVALLACYQPARRATRVDPVVALRSE